MLCSLDGTCTSLLITLCVIKLTKTSSLYNDCKMLATLAALFAGTRKVTYLSVFYSVLKPIIEQAALTTVNDLFHDLQS